MPDTKLNSEYRAEVRPDWWFTAVAAAGAFAAIAVSVTSWLPISDAMLTQVQIPVSVLAGIAGGILGYLDTHRRPRQR